MPDNQPESSALGNGSAGPANGGLLRHSRKRTRIQVQNEERIVSVAMTFFAQKGFRGTTIDEVARAAEMSKANVLYYFKSKEDMYRAVLEHTLSEWLDPFADLDPAGDPIDEICNYARNKLKLSRESAVASRLFATEIIQGAPVIGPYLQGPLKEEVTARCKTLQQWIDEGRLAPVDPLQLIFLIWSATQHYADFRMQIDALHDGDEEALFTDAERTLTLVLRNGLRPSADS